MMKYGSIYLKGKFLDADVLPGIHGSNVGKDYVAPMEDSSDEGEEGERTEDEDEMESGEEHENGEFEAGRDEGEDNTAKVQAEAVPEIRTSVVSQTTSLPIRPPQLPTVQPSASLTVDFDLEKRQSLGVLASIFGTSAGTVDEDDEDDWIGKESVGSDVDEANPVSGHPGEDGNDFEVVPRENGRGERQEHTAGDEILEGAGSNMVVDEESGDIDEPVVETTAVKGSPKPQKEPQLKGSTKLKDLFAPTEAEGM